MTIESPDDLAHGIESVAAVQKKSVEEVPADRTEFPPVLQYSFGKSP